ncbi:hypothetical protein C8J56DRAFT_1042578 [Mycena floridula]|nr:hypothetical protein C8J56DRAFT_1042578 [Mycena floridula]
MSQKNLPSPPQPTSKLPKFLQKQATRDRSKSVVEGSPTSPSSSSVPDLPFGVQKSPSASRKNAKLFGAKAQSASSTSNEALAADAEPPVIVEPLPARPRTRSDRPSSTNIPTMTQANSTYDQLSTSPGSSRIGERLSGWFSHTFSTSSTDLSLPSLLSQSNAHYSNANSSGNQSTASPRGKLAGAGALLTAAKHGKGHLDKAVRYLLDSDATPDKCTDPIWLLGVQHRGWEPTPPTSFNPSQSTGNRRTSNESHRGRNSPTNFRSSTSSSSSDALSQSTSSSKHQKDRDPGANWPPHFYHDFTSRVWLTYRSGFVPIRDVRLGDLPMPRDTDTVLLGDIPSPTRPNRSHSNTGSYGSDYSSSSNSASSHPSSYPTASITKKWSWGLPAALAPAGLGGEKGWTSDSGWGYWRRPISPPSLPSSLLPSQGASSSNLNLSSPPGSPQSNSSHPSSRSSPGPPPSSFDRSYGTPSPEPRHEPEQIRPEELAALTEYATYIRILTWFLDNPSPYAPFSVHRLALAGKELGKDVGMWFGPSTAAGGIKTLVNSFPESGLGVSVASDGLLFKSDVFAASHSTSSAGPYASRNASHRSKPPHEKLDGWGDRPVLLLFGVRLGIDGVNPIYYDTVKALYTFPQSVGIAGGRPSSSYYFVGSQTDSLFYLDPHHARPAIPLRMPGAADAVPVAPAVFEESHPEKEKEKRFKKGHRSTPSASKRAHATISPSPSVRSSNSGNHHAISPSPLGQEFPSDSERIPPTSSPLNQSRSRKDDMDPRELSTPGGVPVTDIPPFVTHYLSAYPSSDLKTFHCDRVRKMPLSGLDPSMLIGFLVRSEDDWWDWKRRVSELPKTIFSVQDEPPTWPSDSDDNMGLESMSDPDEESDSLADINDEEQEDDSGRDQYFDTRSASRSTSSSHGGLSQGSARSEGDTEEDPVDPVTPGPVQTRFDIPPVRKGSYEDFVDASADIEDDWIDPVIPSPPPISQTSSNLSQSSRSSAGSTNGAKKKHRSSSGAKSKSKDGGKRQKQIPVPVPGVKVPATEHYPFPVSQRETEPDIPAHSDPGTSDNGWSDGIQGRMHTARARDGGRTQSGGVRGILTED